MTFGFQVNATDGHARVGMLSTAHGQIATPAFMPVATQGSVKAIAPDDLKSLGATILLSNTYHLMLRPGIQVVRNLGRTAVRLSNRLQEASVRGLQPSGGVTRQSKSKAAQKPAACADFQPL